MKFFTKFLQNKLSMELKANEYPEIWLTMEATIICQSTEFLSIERTGSIDFLIQ